VRLLPSTNGWRRMMDSISAAAFSTKYNSSSVWTVLTSCLLYFFADPVQSERGYENTLRLFELRSSGSQVARAVP
jgi:hypothetical protein